MNRLISQGLFTIVMGAAVGACSGTSDMPPGDTGVATADTGMPGVDTGVAPDDTGVAPDDTGVAPDDTGVAPDDTGTADVDAGTSDANVLFPDGALMCAAGVECTNYAAELAAAPRGAAGDTEAAALANCVIQMHQSDCCGAMDANGINHGARTTLCPAEATCEAQYASPAGCTDNTITTDTGETTTVMADVRLRVVDPTSCTFGTCYTCETFVCTTGPCRTAPGIAGGCGP